MRCIKQWGCSKLPLRQIESGSFGVACASFRNQEKVKGVIFPEIQVGSAVSLISQQRRQALCSAVISYDPRLAQSLWGMLASLLSLRHATRAPNSSPVHLLLPAPEHSSSNFLHGSLPHFLQVFAGYLPFQWDLLYLFNFAAITNYQKHSDLKTTQIYYLTALLVGSSVWVALNSNQGVGGLCSFLKVLGEDPFPTHLGCWQNLSPCDCRTEAHVSLLAFS